MNSESVFLLDPLKQVMWKQLTVHVHVHVYVPCLFSINYQNADVTLLIMDSTFKTTTCIGYIVYEMTLESM